MSNMKRLLVILGIASLILVATLAITIWQLGPITEKILSHKLGVLVTIENISYEKDLIVIDNIVIGNPPGSKLPYAMKIKHIGIKAPFDHYFRKTIVFEEFLFLDVDMNIEFYDAKHSRGNWNSIIERLQSEESDQTDTGSSRNAIINELVLKNLNFQLLLPGSDKPTKLAPLKSLKFEDVQTENGDLTGRVAEAILNHVVQAVFWKYAIQSTLEFPFQVSDTAFETVFNSFKGLFGK